MRNNAAKGHLAALVTILIWGTTFISTKVLLNSLQPVEILFCRFLLGWLALWIVCPRRLKGTTIRQEGLFAAAGLCGVCLYYLLENIALTCTMASNVSVIVSSAPFFTAILSGLVWKRGETLRANFLVGFAAAMAGIGLISFHGGSLQIAPAGDLLALLAAFLWACYSVLTRIIGGEGYSTILTTRRVFSYGILFMIPALFLLDFCPDLSSLADPVCLLNLLFLGLGASALCFVTWNYAVKELGAVQTSLYIYLVPVITVAASILVLHEPFAWTTGAGMALTLAGLWLSERKQKGKEEEENGPGE